jgi:hypothetical protein
VDGEHDGIGLAGWRAGACDAKKAAGDCDVVADVEGIERAAGHDAVVCSTGVRSMRRSKGRKRGRPPALEACSGVWHSTQSARLEYGTGAYWRNPQRGHLTIGT